ncbi:MAG: tRNA lysidine(34) synthetase TilS [Lentisphaeria bacterium]
MTARSTDQIRRKVAATIAEHALLNNLKRLYIGFSGGPDSTALLLLMQGFPLGLEAVHLNHGIRKKEADLDAAWCHNFCQTRGIKFSVHNLDVPKQRRPGENLEAAARRCRLDFWESYAGSAVPQTDNAEISAVALGHHADDALEDLFLRLGRGSNASGLTALRPRRRIRNTTFIRPLLGLTRNDIQAFLNSEGVNDWRIDHTNRDLHFRRNAIRHKLIPVLQEIWGTEAGFYQALKALREDAEYLEQELENWRTADLTPKYFREIPPALQHRVFRRWLSEQLGTDYVPRHPALTRLRSAVCPPIKEIRQVPLGSDVTLEVDRDTIRIKPPAAHFEIRHWNWRDEPELALPEFDMVLKAKLAPAPSPELLRQTSPNCEYFKPDSITETLEIRPPRPGDRLIPFGHKSATKLKDIFNAAGIPPLKRSRYPLLMANQEPLWLIGVRRSTAALPEPISNTRRTSEPALCLYITMESDPRRKGVAT